MARYRVPCLRAEMELAEGDECPDCGGELEAKPCGNLDCPLRHPVGKLPFGLSRDGDGNLVSTVRGINSQGSDQGPESSIMSASEPGAYILPPEFHPGYCGKCGKSPPHHMALNEEQEICVPD